MTLQRKGKHMGVDLSPAKMNGVYSLNWGFWRSMLNLGEEYGWVPRGTSDPYPYEEWGQPGRYFVPTPERHTHEGTYDLNDGWYVDPEDARALGG
jgi:hypothetical protein